MCLNWLRSLIEWFSKVGHNLNRFRCTTMGGLRLLHCHDCQVRQFNAIITIGNFLYHTIYGPVHGRCNILDCPSRISVLCNQDHLPDIHSHVLVYHRPVSGSYAQQIAVCELARRLTRGTTSYCWHMFNMWHHHGLVQVHSRQCQWASRPYMRMVYNQ